MTGNFEPRSDSSTFFGGSTEGLCRINLRKFADDDQVPNCETARTPLFPPLIFLPLPQRSRQKNEWWKDVSEQCLCDAATLGNDTMTSEILGRNTCTAP